MGYRYKVKGYYTPKEKIYIKTKLVENYPLFEDDILTKSEDGTFMKHTGLGLFGLVIDESLLEYHEDEAQLQII